MDKETDARTIPDSTRSMKDEDARSFQEKKESVVVEFEREYFSRLLTDTMGNVARAARRINITRQNLSKRLKKIGIDPAGFRPKD